MAMEILVAKLIGPYFGSSLYVWAATIGTTLIGLATGYYYAGKLCEKPNLDLQLFKITLVTAVFILVLPFLSGLIMEALMGLEVKMGIILSTLIFNFPLFFLFGLYSPIIIQLMSNSDNNAGDIAGRIYGLSTLSGVVFMVVLGVFILPNYSMYISVYGCGLMMLVTSFTYYFKKENSEK